MEKNRKSGTKVKNETTNLDCGSDLDWLGIPIQIFYKMTKKRPCENLHSLNLELWRVFFANKRNKKAKKQITMAGTQWTAGAKWSTTPVNRKPDTDTDTYTQTPR